MQTVDVMVMFLMILPRGGGDTKATYLLCVYIQELLETGELIRSFKHRTHLQNNTRYSVLENR